MDLSNATNYCAHCLSIVDESTLQPFTLDNQITMPITLRFCEVCFQKMCADDEQVMNLMWERYEIILPYEEARLNNRIDQRIAMQNAASC